MFREQDPSKQSAFEGVRTATPSSQELYLDFSIEKIIVEIFWGSTVKTKLSRSGLSGAFYKALVTNSHVPSFSSSGVFETTMSAGFVNASTWR